MLYSNVLEFFTDVQGHLPYPRDEYIDFLDDDYLDETNWIGISFQPKGQLIPLKKESILQSLFTKILDYFDHDSYWVVNHDDKDMMWFPVETNQVKDLQLMFRNHNIENQFRGCFVISKDELLSITEDITLYPFKLSFKNLDISHITQLFIIKITSHLTIDLITQDYDLLDRIVKSISSEDLEMKKYR